MTLSQQNEVLLGALPLRRYLRRHVCDVRELDLDGFRAWLHGQRQRWERSPVFAQRVRIRELRRVHPQLAALERERQRLQAEDAAAPSFVRLEALARARDNLAKALTGLAGAHAEAVGARKAALAARLAAFHAQAAALAEEEAALLGVSPLRRALQAVEARLASLRLETGLDVEERRLSALLRQGGRRAGTAGTGFEAQAGRLVARYVVPQVYRGRDRSKLAILSGVTLGAARIELDQVVVRLSSSAAQPVQVLAVVEAKRNPNDLARGFRQRQENIAWLTGAADGYAPEQYRNRRFPTGRFDTAAVHRQDQRDYLFQPDSFGRLEGTPRSLERLYFVTRARTLWGLSSAALARLQHRVATDLDWAPGDDVYLESLRRWCQGLATPVETPDVLHDYLQARRGRQILLVPDVRAPHPSP